MLLDGNHAWAKHAAKEAQFVIDNLGIVPGSHSVLDFGCGNGRHAIELTKHGVSVVAVDYIEDLLVRGRKALSEAGYGHADPFVLGDCRSVKLEQQFDAAICLYDVVGSYADEAHNQQILLNLAKHLRPGGKALISVMNMAMTVTQGQNFFSLKTDAKKLRALRPSHTMEKTGNVFRPEFYLIDQDTGIVYRKEQFNVGTELPAELVVRDRRYYPVDIETLCRNAGLSVRWSRMVQAGRWDVDLSLNDPKAKEILVLCSKPAG